MLNKVPAALVIAQVPFTLLRKIDEDCPCPEGSRLHRRAQLENQKWVSRVCPGRRNQGSRLTLPELKPVLPESHDLMVQRRRTELLNEFARI